MPAEGYKRSKASIEKQRATLAAKRNGHTLAPNADKLNGKDAAVYLRHALQKWPEHKKARGISKLYVELALATLEGRA